MNVGRSLTVSLNKEYQKEIQELCEAQGYKTYKQLFNAAIAALKAKIEDDDGDIDSQLLAENESLKKRISKLMEAGPEPAPTPTKIPFNDEGYFVAEVPSVARETVAKFVKAMYDEHGYTSKSEILKHWVAIHQSIGKGEKVIVKVSKRLMRLLEKFSKDPIDNGQFTDVGHYAGQKLQEALILQEKASVTEPTPGKKTNLKPKKQGEESEEEEEFSFWKWAGF